MFWLTWQTMALLAAAYFTGCWIACMCRRALGRGVEEPAYEPRRLLAKIEDGGVLDVTGAVAVASSAYVIAILDVRGDVWIAKDYPTPKVKRSCGAGATRVALAHRGQFLVCGKDRPEHIFAVRKR